MVHKLRERWAGLTAAARQELSRSLRDSESDLSATIEEFAADGWLQLQPQDRALLAECDRCTACEACNSVCPLITNAKLTVFSGPMQVPLSVARQTPGFRCAAATIAVFERCGVCRACEEACPQQIPILELVRHIGRALARDPLRSALGSDAGGPGHRHDATQDPG